MNNLIYLVTDIGFKNSNNKTLSENIQIVYLHVR